MEKKIVKETGGTVENIGNNELDEEKKGKFRPNGDVPNGRKL